MASKPAARTLRGCHCPRCQASPQLLLIFPQEGRVPSELPPCFLLQEATSSLWLLFYRKSRSMSFHYVGFSTPKPISLNCLLPSAATPCPAPGAPSLGLSPQ